MEKGTTLTGVFNGAKGIKKIVNEFLRGRDIGCFIQNTTLLHGESTGQMTLLVLQGKRDEIYEARDALVSELIVKFPNLDCSKWTEGALPLQLKDQIVKPAQLNKEITTAVNAEVAGIGKALKREIIAASGNLLISTFNVDSVKTREACSWASSLTDELTKHIYLTYRSQTVYFNIYNYPEWNLLKEGIKKYWGIDGEIKIMHEKMKAQIIDYAGFVRDEKYFMTVSHGKPKNMNEFYERLKTVEVSEAGIAEIKEKMEAQRIQFEDLMEQGDLAMDPEKLEHIGICKWGHRIAILQTIRGKR